MVFADFKQKPFFLNKKKYRKKPPESRVVFFWSYWPDLNRRPADYESAALPTEPQ